ncbi:MAG: sortase [Candidatus Peribacteraceae bacterium]|nr:sortase [Candidatus Peribacteraceae bacterium]
MKKKQQVLAAYFLATYMLAISFILWTTVLAEQVGEEERTGGPVVSFDAWGDLPGESGGTEHPAAPAEAAPSEPPVADASSAKSSSSAGESAQGGTPRSELQEWEIAEHATLSIPAIHVRVPVLLPSLTYWGRQEWDLLEKQMQVGLRYGVVEYPHSVTPGRRGTVFIAGHSSPPSPRAEASAYGHVFAQLPQLEKGDAITLSAGGTTFTFEVIDTQVVPAGETSILLQEQERSLLKIITCYPVGTTKDRLVVVAELQK